MLLQFNFKNFKSFRDDTSLDLSATRQTEYINHLSEFGKYRVLPIACLYGANASGKSNVIEAFKYMTRYVVDSFNYGGDDSAEKDSSGFYAPTPFLLDDSKDKESYFEVYFTIVKGNIGRIYNYGFSVNKNGVNEEWLNYKGKSSSRSFRRVFYRNSKENVYDYCGLSVDAKTIISNALEKEALVVSLGSKLKISVLKSIREWFMRNLIIDFGKPLENFIKSEELPIDFATSKRVQKKVLKYFSSFDSSIVDFDVEVIHEDEKSAKVRVDACHSMIGSNKKAKIPLKLESAGTLKMFALYAPLHSVLNNGGVLFIDELNARLHPLLVRAILITFVKKETNPYNAQIVFTSHDSWLMDGNVLRRDEIWFIEKNSYGISSLYSLTDFVDKNGDKIRKDENYTKNYMLGKYGAIPHLEQIDLLDRGLNV